MPTSLPLSMPGKGRIRFSVIVFATAWRSSCGWPMMTSRVMRSPTRRAKTASFFAASRTMSRSDRIPTGLPAASATMSAPMLWRASTASASRMFCSGRTVTAVSPFVARMLAMSMVRLLLEDRSFDVPSPHLAQPADDLAHRGPRRRELDRDRHQVDVRVGRLAGQPLEQRGDADLVPPRPRRAEPRQLARLDVGRALVHLQAARLGRLDELVHADHRQLARRPPARVLVGGGGHLPPDPARLARLRRAAQRRPPLERGDDLR